MPHVVTEISQAKRNTDRVNIYLNGRFWIGLSKNDLVSLRLFKGKELSDLEKQEIEKTALNSNLIGKAINYIQVRPRSCAEVRDYLVFKKGIAEEEADNIISYLQEHDLLSDEKFAQWYVDYKLRSGVNGINKIKMELLQKKVSTTIINEILDKLKTNDEFQQSQTTQMEEYVKKISKTIKAKDAYDFKSKLISRLMARGFKYSDIKTALNSSNLNAKD